MAKPKRKAVKFLARKTRLRLSQAEICQLIRDVVMFVILIISCLIYYDTARWIKVLKTIDVLVLKDDPAIEKVLPPAEPPKGDRL